MTRRDYNALYVEAARRVLLEVVRVLGEYRDAIAIVGGWVPELLLADAEDPHVGSIDVDLALDPGLLEETGYATICARLEQKDYRVDPDGQPFRFFRTVSVEGQEIKVELDLLAPEYGGTGKSHRTQRVQDVRARKARGCDIVFGMTEELEIRGSRPDGVHDTARVQIAGVVPFLVMKGMALVDRDKEKDSYDICYVLRHYEGGPETVAAAFRPHLDHGLVKEALVNIAGKFASPDHVGPVSVADFEEATDPEDRALIQRDAYERVAALLERLGVRPR